MLFRSGEDEQEKYLSPYPKRKSVVDTKDAAQVLPLIQEQTDAIGCVYEDLPPPSMLDAYRSGQLADNEREVLRNSPPRASPPTPNFVHPSPEPTTPKENPPVQLDRSDSLLDRVFAYFGSDAHATNTDLDHTTESRPSRPASLWRAGGADVVPKRVEERSTVAQTNVSDGAYPHPVRGEVVGVDSVPAQNEKPPTPPLKRSHIRGMADRSMAPLQSPLPCWPSPVVEDLPARRHAPKTKLLPLQQPGIPEQSAGYPPEQVTRGAPGPVYQFTAPNPRPHSPQRLLPIPDSSPPSQTPRPRHANRNETLVRPFPKPARRLPRSMGLARFTPTRSKLKLPAPLAQLESESSNRNEETGALPLPEGDVFSGKRPYRGPPGYLRKHSQPIPPPYHKKMVLHYTPHPPDFLPRNPHHRSPQSLPVLQEATRPDMNPSSRPPHRSSRGFSTPPSSGLPSSRQERSSAILRGSQSPNSRLPSRLATSRVNPLTGLRTAPLLDENLTRYPVPGSNSRINSPPSTPRSGRTRSPPTPRTPTFVNTHMLPPQANSPRSDVGELNTAVSSFPQSVRTK